VEVEVEVSLKMDYQVVLVEHLLMDLTQAEQETHLL
tara:strand:+ start:164 stop:271 length:108 start_codon:yes stop_codon:yes gene_type:complete